MVLTEGGDPDKLGRGTVWRGQLPLCLHQNHIFRVRVTSDLLDPNYLSAYLASKPAKAYFLRAAKQTTGIASINMTQLRNTPIYLPSLDKQLEYLRRIREVVALQGCAESQAKAFDELLISLASRAFSGQLKAGGQCPTSTS
ncbi:restriction endonuclease subunit S [Mycobacterium mantenii]|uniref:restriction endonuclease subunit S n=1 Tax=Mycobacterium mantenii TaxID=560555 RepID=UPI001A9754DF